MAVLNTALDPRSPPYLEARAAMLAGLVELDHGLDLARDCGGERAVTRHHARGKLLARERVELLVDRDSPLLELSPVAGRGSPEPVGGGLVTAIGVVEHRICVLAATEPTIPAAVTGRTALAKLLRAQRIARQNQLPMVSLYEAEDADPAGGVPGSARLGEVVAGYAQLAAARVPTVGVYFGFSGAVAGVDLTAPLEALVTVGPQVTERPADHVAEDDRDAIRLTRQCVRWWPEAAVSTPAGPVTSPKYDPEDLLAAPPHEPREILSRVLDGSRFEEQPGGGAGLRTGWGELHGHRVAVLAHTGAPCGRLETEQALRLIARAGHRGTPVLVLQHGGAAAAGAEPAITTAVVRGDLPVLVVQVGRWQGPAALAAVARFRFSWPVPAGRPGDHAGTVDSAESQTSGPLCDDGPIDPRDTRTVLGLCLSVTGRGRP